jgi:hypothetical protein
MSLRYAHPVPDHRREAVAKLNDKPILALTEASLAADVALSIDYMVEREDSNLRPRHYESSAQAESTLISIAYAGQIPLQGRFRPSKAA